MSGAPAEMQPAPAGADEYRVRRERRIAPRIERDVGAARPEVIVGSAERDVGVRDVGAERHHAEQPALRAAAQLGPLIVHLEVRVLALRDAERSQHARQRPALKRPLRFERRAPGCAPRQRHRERARPSPAR